MRRARFAPMMAAAPPAPPPSEPLSVRAPPPIVTVLLPLATADDRDGHDGQDYDVENIPRKGGGASGVGEGGVGGSDLESRFGHLLEAIGVLFTR